MTLRRLREPVLLALGSVAAAEAFAFFLPETAQPFHRAGFLVVLAAVIASAWRGGLFAALVAGGLGALGIAHLFLVFGGPLGPPPIRLTVGGTIGAFGLALATLIGHLRDRERRALAKEQEVAANLRDANRALREANEALEAFTYVVTHDLKEPVRAVDATLGAAMEDYGEDERVPSELRGLIRQARDANERLDHLMRGLLDLSRVSRIDPRDMRKVVLADAIASDDCRAHYAALAEQRHGEVRNEVPPELTVFGHQGALCQLFGNLIGNALRHNAGPRPTVRLHARQADRQGVEVVVEDDGAGFPPTIVAAFERGEPARSTRGSGFGLTIARRAVESMGGTLRLGASPDLGGAAAFVRLPLDPASIPAEDASAGRPAK